MQMDPQSNDGQLRIPADHGGKSRTPDTHGRRAEVAEDQHIVQNQIHEHGGDARSHGNGGLSGFPEGAGISVAQGEGQQAPEHHMEIIQTIVQYLAGILGTALALQVESDESGAAGQENAAAQSREQQTHQGLEPEGVADTFRIRGAVELGGEDTGAGGGAEYAEIEYEEQAVHHGNAAHGEGSHLAHHDVVQKGHKVGVTCYIAGFF